MDTEYLSHVKLLPFQLQKDGESCGNFFAVFNDTNTEEAEVLDYIHEYVMYEIRHPRIQVIPETTWNSIFVRADHQ